MQGDYKRNPSVCNDRCLDVSNTVSWFVHQITDLCKKDLEDHKKRNLMENLKKLLPRLMEIQDISLAREILIYLREEERLEDGFISWHFILW